MTGAAVQASDVFAHAKRLLAGRGVLVERVVDVQPDSILYVSRSGRAMTAWLRVGQDPRDVRIVFESGFPPEPSASLEKTT